MKNILGTQLYNQKEVASLLGVTTNTVRKYMKEGKINSTLIGGRHYVCEEEIKRFLGVLPPIK
jgi:excisionase family DNA binding protein